MYKSNKIMSDVIHNTKYARYSHIAQRRETFEETVARNWKMHHDKYILDETIPAFKRISLQGAMTEAYLMVRDKKILPSMRSMQFAGKAIEANNARMYNCAYLPIDSLEAFSETIYLLLGGTGVGYSVQRQHVSNLPHIPDVSNSEPYLHIVEDSIMGWADAVKVLFESRVRGKRVQFDYSNIRPEGAELRTAGGKAPGADPLKRALENVERVLDGVSDFRGGTIHPIDAHDMLCYLSDAVVAGGIRRSALISLFSPDDPEMLYAKSGDWWNHAPQRGRANNSVVLERGKVPEQYFRDLMKKIKDSGAGEPGILWTNNTELGTNPLNLAA